MSGLTTASTVTASTVANCPTCVSPPGRARLITDGWESPLADEADVLIRLPREAAGPIDPITLEVAVTELSLVTVVARLRPAERLAELDELTRDLQR